MKNCNRPPRQICCIPFCTSGEKNVQVWAYDSHLLHNEYITPNQLPWHPFVPILILLWLGATNLLMTRTSAYLLSASYCCCGYCIFTASYYFPWCGGLEHDNIILYEFIVIQHPITTDTISMSNPKKKAMGNAWFFHNCFFLLEQNDVLLNQLPWPTNPSHKKLLSYNKTK